MDINSFLDVDDFDFEECCNYLMNKKSYKCHRAFWFVKHDVLKYAVAKLLQEGVIKDEDDMDMIMPKITPHTDQIAKVVKELISVRLG